MTSSANEQEWDDSPGDVIHAYPDGTIMLDDSIITYHPIRACRWYQARIEKQDKQIEELRGALRTYGVHTANCQAGDGSPLPCSPHCHLARAISGYQEQT